MRIRFLLFYLFSLISACSSPEDLIKAGRYDIAIRRYSQKNLDKPENVRGLEYAFKSAQNRDLELASILLTAKPDVNWPEIHGIYLRIQTRQSKMAEQMPVRDRNGYTAQFEWLANIDSLEFAAREHAADQLYEAALAQLDSARLGDRYAARTAYDQLCRLEKNYFPAWQEAAELKKEAKKLGTVFILVNLDQGLAFNSPYFMQELNLGWHLSNQHWQVFHTAQDADTNYDYVANLDVESLDVSFENRSEFTRTEEKDIETGQKLTYDSTGQVVERTPIYEKVQASITEIRITKSAYVRIRLELMDAESRLVRYWDTITADENFDKTWVTISGDRRALSSLPMETFGIPSGPTDWDIVRLLADNARWSVLNWFYEIDLRR